MSDVSRVWFLQRKCDPYVRGQFLFHSGKKDIPNWCTFDILWPILPTRNLNITLQYRISARYLIWASLTFLFYLHLVSILPHNNKTISEVQNCSVASMQRTWCKMKGHRLIKYFLFQECQSRDEVPRSRIIKTSTLASILEMDSNDKMRQNLENISRPKVTEIFLSGWPSLRIRLFLPPGYRKTDELRFPLLVYL